MKRLIIIGLLLASCKKETPTPPPPVPQCDCFEQHQVFIQGMGWANDYKTDTVKMNCNSETGEYIFTNAEQTKRYYIQCN